jgi:hypothetical protein
MNPVTIWWGEGDEKIWVDGEAFPSIFGTGTEDYYAYSWGGKHTSFYEHFRQLWQYTTTRRLDRSSHLQPL